MTPRRSTLALRALALTQCVWLAVGCGSSSSSVPSGSGTVTNTVSVQVNSGPPSVSTLNILYASVTICEPGTSNCQTIDDVQVDTGSSGLRLLSSAVNISLPLAAAPGGGTLAECTQFSNSSTWGTVRTADVKLGGETASSLPIQVIGDPAFATVPTACTNGGFPSQQDQASLGANGIIGVGNYIADCGTACELTGSQNPGAYWSCASASSCTVTALSSSQQVQNPVAFFSTDNNGVVITLPAVGGTVAPVLSGTMYFGIGTQSNNGMGSATVYTFDGNGYMGTQFNGKSLPYSFIDSGSSGYAFPDSSIQVCSDYQMSFYCPNPSPVNLSGVITGANGASSAAIPFSVGNADQLFNQYPTYAVFPTVCSPALVTDATSPNGPNSFDWGLSFFYGRTVITALEQHNTPGGPGPYVAF
jgi:hypothetical protein